MFVDKGKSFQPLSQTGLTPRSQPTNPLAPQRTGQSFHADGLSVSQILGQQGKLRPPLPADEASYPESMPQNLMRDSFVTKLMFTLKSPLLLFQRSNPDAIVSTGHKDVHGNTIRLARDAAAGLDKVYALAKQRGLSLRVVSSYRSVDQQKYLWEQALKKYGSAAAARKWVAPPGRSRHNSGKAIDIYMYRNGKQIPQKEFDALVAEAGMYRPMSWEGWHIEPLSTKALRAAGKMQDED